MADEYEEFEWKSDGKIFKGVGIYHLTLNVACDALKLGVVRGCSKEEIAAVVQPLLDAGEACDASNPKYVAAVKGMAWVELTPFGLAVERDLGNFDKHHKGTKVCQKVVMDSHAHIVVWVQKDCGKSIRQMAQGFRTGITQVAREMGVWPVSEGAEETGATHPENNDAIAGIISHGNNDATYASITGAFDDGLVSVSIEQVCGTCPYHVFEIPFIRTLYAEGQLRTMIDYVILNPYRRWIMVLYPQLFKLHRVTRIAGLKFRSLGNHWLLDWPLRQMVECSRKTTQADWDEQLKDVMERAEAGAVTYTAAMNEGERYIADHIKAAGYPLVLLMKDGFPPVGSEEEKKYKPGGMMSDICSQGRLLLLEAYPESYEDSRIVDMTERSLRVKAEKRGWRYEPLPHSTLRWRSIACNEMMRMLSER